MLLNYRPTTAACPLRVNITNRVAPVDSVESPTLEAFQEAAREGDWVHVSRDGAHWKVLATGTTPSQRSVAWIEPEPGVDTTSAFVSALGQSFSSGIQTSVARELGLVSGSGKPLSSRTVIQAIDMAQTSRQAMAGVDFMTLITVTAVGNSVEFSAACQAAGLSGSAFDLARREAIDAAMKERFETAQMQGQSPVSMQIAREWLREELIAARSMVPRSP